MYAFSDGNPGKETVDPNKGPGCLTTTANTEELSTDPKKDDESDDSLTNPSSSSVTEQAGNSTDILLLFIGCVLREGRDYISF